MYQIIYTTDGKYIGELFEYNGNPVTIAGTQFEFTYVKEGTMAVFANSNYVINAIKQ